MKAIDLLQAQLRGSGLPEMQMEYRFHPLRKFRFDGAYPDLHIAVEIQGGVWIQGQHTRGKGYMRDMEKHNLATQFDWKLYYYTPDQVQDGIAVSQLREAIETKRKAGFWV